MSLSDFHTITEEPIELTEKFEANRGFSIIAAKLIKVSKGRKGYSLEF